MQTDALSNALDHGFIDKDILAEGDLVPQFLINDASRGEKVITTLKQEMQTCDEFMFSVAFVTNDGINALLSEFKYLSENNIKGRILASQYQNFTDPKALRKLSSFRNIEVRIVTEEQMKMHSKCYIFSKKGGYEVILGSSNLTNNALCTNGEWNIKFNSSVNGDIIEKIIAQFNKDFENATRITEVWIEEYSLIYKEFRSRRLVTAESAQSSNRVSPNKMQAQALKNLQILRSEGKDRALLVSATGSGKTYLSAFDAKIFGGKFLYIVHRKDILNKSMKSFSNVLQKGTRIERYDPESNDLSADCLFSTIQTMSQQEVLDKVPGSTFDYILIDEVHHAGAESYQRLINHFKPKFLLGMTATPDRTDSFDIYNLFDYNIAYNIRLKEAMEMNLICPFHYFGIADLFIDGEEYDDDTVFSKLEIEQRVDHVIEQAEYYGYSGDRVKGIVFCRRISEAQTYSDLFNEKGYKTAWVSGMLNSKEVETYIERLESDDSPLKLDYIFTADLFNEGIDIPSVNQIIMLRPTASPIIYIQQLGRGLRLHNSKDFVVILDFIGNYEKNYNIPLALSDDHTYNKSEIRRFVTVGDNLIPGNSTISFDSISKKKIFESIDRSDLSSAKLLVDSYKNLKMKLGRIPKLTDFAANGSIDALKFISKYKSYHNFLTRYEKDYKISFTEKESKVIEFVSRIIAAGKRKLEIEILNNINSSADAYRVMIQNHPEMNEVEINNIISVFSGRFYNNNVCIWDGETVSAEYLEMLRDENFREHVEDIIKLGEYNNQASFSQLYPDTNFVLNRMYTYEDACRLLNWGSDINAINIGGYKYDSVSNTFAIFINYVKNEDTVESQRYEDHFENRNTLIALSKSTEDKNAKNMVRVRDHIKNGTAIHLFVRKNKDDAGSKEFYYLGLLDFDRFLDNGKPVKICYRLRNEIRSDLFEYFNSNV